MYTSNQGKMSRLGLSQRAVTACWRSTAAGFISLALAIGVSAGSLVLEQGSVLPGGTVLRGEFLGQIAVGGIDTASGFDAGNLLQLESGTLPFDAQAFLGRPLAITALKPGNAAPGDKITVSGSGFLSARILLVGSSQARFTVIDDQTLQFIMPQTALGGRVLVASLSNKAISQDSITPVLSGNGPQVASITPATVHPGDSIMIKGSYLGGTTNLLLGKTQTEFSIQDDSLVLTKAPNTPGTFFFVVESVVGTTGTKQSVTIVLPPTPPQIVSLSPASAPRGGQVTLAGVGLTAISSLTINGSPALFSIQDDSRVAFTVPDNATTGAIRVETKDGLSAVSENFQVEIPNPRPWFDANLVLQGQPGDQLIVRGGGFDQARQILVGGVPASFTLRGASEMEVRIPNQSQSGPITLVTDTDTVTSEHSIIVRIPGLPPPPAPVLNFTSNTEGSAPQFVFQAQANVPYVVEAIADLGLNVWNQSQGVLPSPLPHSISLPAFGSDPAVIQQYFRVHADALPFDNWDFEEGLTGWAITGNAFTNQPTFGECYYKDDVNAQPIVDAIGGDYWSTRVHIGHHGDWWIGTGQNHPSADSPVLRNPSVSFDARTGTLQSPRFVLDKPFMSFLVGGSSATPVMDPGNVRPRVQLQVQPKDKFELAAWTNNIFYRKLKDGYFVVSETGLVENDKEQFRREVIDVSSFTNRNARLVIVDDDPNGHINVDDFRFSATDPRPDLLYIRNYLTTRIYRDPDAPVWGFADTHAHPAAQLGFGGQLIAGLGDEAPEISLQSCEYVHGFNGANIKVPHHSDPILGGLEDELSFFTSLGGLINTPTIVMDAFAGFGGHRTSGYQYGFDGWPTITEQGVHPQMHVDWIKRAWQGGLRLMVAHTVHTKVLGEMNGTDGYPIDDTNAVVRQITAIKAMAAHHADFMEVALTPRDARRIIHQGKMAVILGIEGDQLAGMEISQSGDVQHLTNYLNHIYNDLGVRHIFPIHLADNVFGGCAIYNNFWDDNNWFLNGYLFDAREPATLGIPDPINFHLPNNSDDNFAQVLQSFGELFSLRFFPPLIYYGRTHANALSLTDFGETLIQESMRRGMIIDTDHTGYLSRNRILDLVSAQNYPVLSGHCGFTELSLSPAVTDDIEKVAAESDNTPTVVARLAALGAMASPITFSKETLTWGTLVKNDCPGSAKTWAQQYLYALDKLGGHNVGLGTDYGLTHGISPRFGFNANFAANGDYRRSLLVQGFNQTNGVRYIEPIGDYRDTRFDGWLNGFIASSPGAADAQDLPLAGLRDHYQGVALFLSGVDPDAVPYPRPSDRPKFIARGMRAQNQAELDYALSHDFPVFADRSKDEVRSGYYVVHNLAPNPGDSDYVHTLVADLRKVYQDFLNMSGNNRPMHRCQMNCIVEADPAKPWVKEWDFNLDGLAHYGLLPDFVQDLKNVGLDDEHLKPLFGSAEDYIRIWERCEANKLR